MTNIKAKDLEREPGLNYNLEEMKSFFMKHQNRDSHHYTTQLEDLNIRNRIKKSSSLATLTLDTPTVPNLRALKRLDYDKPNLNKQLKIGLD